MNPTNTPFTAIYAQWLESFRAMIPGARPSGPPEELTPKQEQAAANQEWEEECGSIQPPAESKPVLASIPKSRSELPRDVAQQRVAVDGWAFPFST